MAKYTNDELLEAFGEMTLVELSEFVKAFELYRGEFHRAARKGNAALLVEVERGMALISENERQQLQEKWLGSSIERFPYMRVLGFLEPRPNQILATVTPNGEAGSVTLICEPARNAWTDWFLVDHGSNLENAEAVTRAMTRRVAQRRRGVR